MNPIRLPRPAIALSNASPCVFRRITGPTHAPWYDFDLDVAMTILRGDDFFARRFCVAMPD
jgi:hypothetical protein